MVFINYKHYFPANKTYDLKEINLLKDWIRNYEDKNRRISENTYFSRVTDAPKFILNLNVVFLHVKRKTLESKYIFQYTVRGAQFGNQKPFFIVFCNVENFFVRCFLIIAFKSF